MKKPIYKKWWIWVMALLVVALIISILYSVGKGVVLDEDKVTYDELQVLIEVKENELDKVTKELKDNEDQYNELLELANDEDDLVERLANYKLEVSELEDVIKENKEELDKVSEELVKVKDDPIKVNPGVDHFGADIETGRYKITYQDGYNGNVFFRGDNSFGETFGKGDYSIEEYTFYAEEDDEIEITIPILLYPSE